MNPAHWLERAAKRSPTAPALFHGPDLIADYATFAESAARLAGGLKSRKITAGDRVAIYMKNAPEYLIALYGIWYLGAIAVPINAKLHAKEAAFILADAQASLVICDAQSAHDFDQSTLVAGGEEWNAMLSGDAIDHPVERAGDDVLWLFYTSGTTGKPKGVMITCANIGSMTMNYFVDVDDVFQQDAILYAAPMSHGAGIYNFMHVLRAARHIIPASGGFDAAEILALAKDRGPISMFAAPTMIKMLVEHARKSGADGQGLRTITYAGGPMYEADILDATDVMGSRFVQVYGQGECPMGITALSRDDVADRTHPNWRARLNSVGRAQSSVRVKILDANANQCPTGHTGEIVVKGATVMKGYWRNPTATAKTIKDGWLWTGDMGFMDADGYVTMVDRSKDMIISGGSNIYPREVEEVLMQHPKVSEAAVIGQADTKWGEAVVAYVVGSASQDELEQLCLDHIARFKRPKRYVFVDALPKNNYGKVLKTELRTWADKGD